MEEDNQKKESVELKKGMGLWTLVALSLTSMAGSGMFVGQIIGVQKAGIFSIFSWIILSIITLIMALVFAELVSIYPTAGGIYEYAKRSFGSFPAFMVGWVTWLVNTIGPSVLLLAAFNLVLPDGMVIESLPFLSSNMIKMMLSIFLIIVLNYVAYRGIDASAIIMIFFAIITVGIALVVFIPSIPFINTTNYSPIFSGGDVVLNMGAIIVTLFFIIEGNFGWESATFLAEETNNPRKTIPKALIISALIIIFLNLLVSIVPMGVIKITEFANIDSLYGYMTNFIYGPQFHTLFLVLLVITFIGAAAGNVIGSPRLILAMARDKLFINSLDAVHPKYRTPYKAIIFQTIVAILVIIVASSEYQLVLSILVPLGLIMYSAALIIFIVLRHKVSDSEREFKAPFPWWTALLLVLFFISVIIMWIISLDNIGPFKIVLSFLFFGIPIYLLLMFYYDPDVIVRLNDSFSFLSLVTERIMIPRKIDRSIFNHIGNIEGKKIFEYGCGVGTLTKELADKAGKDGRVYALDVSFNSLKIAKKRLEKKGCFNVSFIHDIHQLNRVHSSIPKVDVIVSIAMLGYIQDMRKVLREMHEILPEGGKVFFVDYVNLFKVLPNVSWLSDPHKLKEIYRQEGFAVKVEIIKGTFWDYVYVYGVKTDQDVPFF